MKFLVIGNGFVGSAVSITLGRIHDVLIQDPPKGLEVDYSEHPDLDGAIICVPTPSDDYGNCDDSLVIDYYSDLRQEYPSLPIMIKSTTSIQTLNSLDTYCDENLIFSPEFLTAANAVEEFSNPKFVIMSGYGLKASLFWGDNVFSKFVKDLDKIFYMDKMSDAGFVKYGINSFLAMKVTFFNELYRMYNTTGFSGDFKNVTEAISLDERIGSSHMDVPGPDGKFGWGGACFPKDTSELLVYAELVNSPLQLLNKAVELNMEHRNETV